MDYANGKIYKLVSNMTDAIYIGSTTQPLAKRKHGHKSKYNLWLIGKQNFVTSFELFKDGGTIDIILIEEFPCSNKMELERRERYHIENNVCVNKCKPAQTREERLKHDKEYYKANTEERRKQIKAHYEANKEKILDMSKERVNCPHCSKEMNRSSLLAHIKRKH